MFTPTQRAGFETAAVLVLGGLMVTVLVEPIDLPSTIVVWCGRVGGCLGVLFLAWWTYRGLTNNN